MLNSYDSVFNFETLIIQGAILLACCYGIVKPIFVISVGYGLAILVFGAILVWFLLRAAFAKGLSSTLVALLIQSIVLGAYGLRLAYFIHQRNKRESYMSSRKGSFSKPVSYALTIPLWILVAFLYLCYGLPVLIGYRAFQNGYQCNVAFHVAGIVIMVAGLIIESLSDYLKNKSKLENPNRFCDIGIYRYCRMPNYFGEMLFWTGCTFSCLKDDMSWLQAGFCVFGIVCAYYIMLHSASALDKSQFDRYHNDEEYMKYRCEVPVLIPFTQWYSMIKVDKTD